MIVNGVTLPDFPSGMFDTYPYGAIYKTFAAGVEIYIAVASKGEIMAVNMPAEATGGIDILYTGTMELGYSKYGYAVGESSDWTLDEETADAEWGLELYQIELVWANHDIQLYDTYTFEPTGEYVFLNATIADEYPEMLAVEGKWLWEVAEQARRLSGKVKRYTTDAMVEALRESSSGASWESWGGAWIRNMVVDLAASEPSATISGESINKVFGIELDKDIIHLSFPNATSIGMQFLMGNSNLKTIDAPLLTNIGAYCFGNCSSLESFNIPLVERVETMAFANNWNLHSLDLPMVNYIGSRAFFYCTSLDTLILRNTSGVCELADNGDINNTPIGFGTGYIYVPSALVDSYKVATNWSTYANQIRAIEDYPEICGTTA